MVAYITEINNDNYQTFIENEFSLIDVWAPWCGPCKLIAPVIDEISSIYVGKLSVGKMNADDNSDLVKQLGIRNIPTLLFFKNGQPLKDESGNPVKVVGQVSKDRLSEIVEQYI